MVCDNPNGLKVPLSLVSQSGRLQAMISNVLERGSAQLIGPRLAGGPSFSFRVLVGDAFHRPQKLSASDDILTLRVYGRGEMSKSPNIFGRHQINARASLTERELLNPIEGSLA